MSRSPSGSEPSKRSPASLAFLVESAELARGGAERASLTMARELARRGIEAGLVAPADRGGDPALVDGVRLERFEIQARGRAARARELAERAAVVARERGFERLVSCGKILGGELWWPHGGVHARARAASVAAGRGPLRAGLAALGRRLRPVERVFDAIESELHATIRSGQARALAISEMVRRDMAALGLEATVLRNGCAVAGPGAPASDGERAGLRERFATELGLDPARCWWLFIAMNPRLKGLGRLTRALDRGSRASDARPLILGVGADMTSSASADFRALGFRDDLPALLAASDGLVLPTHYDPCSLVTLEAMAAGRAIITTANNGAAELLEPGVSVELVEAVEELASSLARLSADGSGREAMGAAARAAAARWTVEDAGDALLAASAG